MQLFLSLTWDLSSSKVYNLSQLTKSLGNVFTYTIWQGIFVVNAVVQESGRRNSNPLQHASQQKWRPEEF
jgi:hypothetical protein